MKTKFKIITISVCIFIAIALTNNCTNKKTTSPILPTAFLMKDYFPLNAGDEWLWDVVIDSTPEPFVDGDINLGEPFVDLNYNGKYDAEIDSFVICNCSENMDLDFDGKYDGPYDPWSPEIPYLDENHNGKYDPPNGKYDEGESFTDMDSNGKWNWNHNLRVSQFETRIEGPIEHSMDGSAVYDRLLQVVFSGPPDWSFIIQYTVDGYSNDHLGLRWHSHREGVPFSLKNDLEGHSPIILAKAQAMIGDSIVNVDTTVFQDTLLYICSWITIFKGQENVIAPAGVFWNCLKFQTIASGWTGEMAKFNGTSYQLYAKNVGLVKSEGPKAGVRWILKSAKINGKNYPWNL